MSDASSFGFGKFIPGFDFLQGLAQSAGSATARPLGRLPEWVAPTVSIEEVDKRITELKAVQFWLDQNGKALAATIQALEVQRMTLSTLQGMNVSMGELAQAFQFPAAATAAATAAAKGAASAGQGDLSDWPMSSAASRASKKEKPQPEPAQAAAAPPAAPEAGKAADRPAAAETAAPKDESAQAAAMGQAMQWWGALTQQFQQIAAKAMAEPMAPEAVAAAQRATGMAGDLAKATMDRMAAQASAFAAQAGKAAAVSPAKAPSAKPAAKAAVQAEAPRTAAKAPAKAAARKTAAKAGAKAPAASKPAAKSRPAR
ncbi:PhaM family polyhydroxyalkanoate granule multifunctional regulatory protein [Delftia tsuruhatensis]|uniref:PhaM family polyhydroxyalkanoate granule multifunctional regulatory protein n=1 Tax=Delftia TaxID=80865 RepID=UPI0028A15EFE|nr:PhaM family polyhydroxyalkanoate granule multifunctional regulatory protein [Delftia tsuruhatensis]